MHGRARISVKDQQSDAGAKEAAKDRRRAAQYGEQLAEVLRNHKNRNFEKDAVEKSAALLRTNPDMYTAWNYRKLALQVLLTEADDGLKATIFEKELLLVFEALQVNPKAYGAWYHRQWTLELMGAHAPLQREFKLLDKLLKQDERNFHGWAYRRFLVRKAAAPIAQEMAFARQKIDETFSNFSAWHYRSKLLTKVHLSQAIPSSSQEAAEWLGEEFELVDNALFTDPNDTSAWIYQSWLLQNTVPNPGAVLTGMWPPPGATVPLTQPPNPTKPPSLPAILCFSRPVTGVNKHTTPVTLTTSGEAQRTGKDWSPVGSRGGTARVWVQDLPMKTGDVCEVHIHVGAGPGILGTDKVQVVRSASSNFTVRMEDDSVPEAIHLDVDVSSRESDASSSTAGSAEDTGARSLPGYASSRVERTREVGTERKWRGELFARQLDLREQQEELEQEKSKWILLGKARLLAAMWRLSGDTSATDKLDMEMSIYADLAALEPAHAEYYWEVLGQLRLEQITGDTSKLQLRLTSFLYHGLPRVQLQLCHLSLRRLSSLEGLLWVQHLDLSHNALRSIEGIEALQLLRSLNLSHNNVSHASGLAALHDLPHIEWLSLANNQLGASTVNTHAYLTSAHPENVKLVTDGCTDKVRRVLAGLAGLDLHFLDLRENEVVRWEGCETFLRNILPRTLLRL